MAGGKDGGTDWMYNQNAENNKEDFLLGKKIGKNFEAEGTMGQLNAVEYDCAPPSIFASQAQHQVDLQRKLLEDPLVAIKKREMEDRKRLLDNPMKMKALQEHIDVLKKMKKDKKKNKKKKKHRGSDSEGSDVDLDLALLQRLERIEGRQEEDDRRKFREQEQEEQRAEAAENKYSDVEPSTPPRDNRIKSSKYQDFSERRNTSFGERKNDFSERRNDFSERRNDFSERRNDFSKRRNDFSERRNDFSERRNDFSERRNHDLSERTSSQSLEKRRPRSRSIDRRRNTSPPRRSRSRDNVRHRSKSSERRYRSPKRDRTKSPRRERLKSPKQERTVSPKVKVKKEGGDEQEKARRLQEMMANASWREDQRARKVRAYRDKDAAEQDQIKTEHDPGFLQRELRKAAANSSVETRIKSNKHNIQRGVGVMDQNFAKR